MSILSFFRRKVRPVEAISAIAVTGLRALITRFEFQAEHKFVDGGIVSTFRVIERTDAPELPDLDGDGLPG